MKFVYVRWRKGFFSVPLLKRPRDLSFFWVVKVGRRIEVNFRGQHFFVALIKSEHLDVLANQTIKDKSFDHYDRGKEETGLKRFKITVNRNPINYRRAELQPFAPKIIITVSLVTPQIPRIFFLIISNYRDPRLKMF